MALRTRVIRDSIHGDIVLDPLQSAIIDTTLFQRLRFVRQNGLLHYVFPGAVHTRFAHSIGAAHLARQAFGVLFPDYPAARNKGAHAGRSGICYLGSVFETAALLHDLGHCAFSHSIEHIQIDGKPFFPPMATLVDKWKRRAPSLQKWWEVNAKSFSGNGGTQHEELGTLMIGVLFDANMYLRPAEVCHEYLRATSDDFSQDVRAMLWSNFDPTSVPLQPSNTFRQSATEVLSSIVGSDEAVLEAATNDLLLYLHSLVSGTLDVDRLDYLIRDSKYIGVPYGICDTNVLINGLCFRCKQDDKKLVLALRSRATSALDDMLWSRYQLFSQVLNHKTNVMLNALLADAIPELIDAGNIPLKPPKELDDFITLTDDFVMSAVLTACVRNDHTDKAYDKALVHRRLPMHLGKINTPDDLEKEKALVEQKRNEHAERLKVPLDKVRSWRVESSLLKGGGIPYILVPRKGNEGIEESLIPPGTDTDDAYQILSWTRDGKLPAKFVNHHFFVER